MDIKLSKEIDSELKKASERLGFDERKIVERAILFYLSAIKNQIDLNKEFKDWEILSDEALINFENSL
ncbi:hypothetical protein HY449_04605 [Candidatus Pacearchaeota archaeon]|nr:hypothetical protein [Candidatus Pacearchaeota archaeon]